MSFSVPDPDPDPDPDGDTPMHLFDHERLNVYQVALDFLVAVEDVVVAFPEGRAYLADQLRRAATSIVLNIAEGAGEFSKRDKARFFRMALRSTTECAAVLDVSRKLQFAGEKQALVGREMLLRIVAMLVALVRKMSVSGSGSGLGSGSEKTRGEQMRKDRLRGES